MLQKVATLSPDAVSIQSPVPYLVQDPQGRFIVKAATGAQFVAFDRSGRFLKTTPVTTGPGRETLVLLPHPARGVMAWLSPSTLAFALGEDLKPVQWPSRVPHLPTFVRDDGTMIVAKQIQTPSLIGHPLHLMSSGGEIVRSFGSDTPEYRPDLRLLMERVAAPASGGSVWTAAKGRYVLEQWDPVRGVRQKRVQVRSSWFVESTDYPRDERTRPKPVLQALWERDGRIWVLIRDADTKWKAGADPERSWSPTRDDAIYDWVLEVVEPATGTVVASRRLGSGMAGRPPQPFLISYSADRAGGLDVWMPALNQKESVR